MKRALVISAAIVAGLSGPVPALAQTAFPATNPNAAEWALIKLTPALVTSAKGGAGVIVGLFDGMTDCRHPDLVGRCTSLGLSSGLYLSYDSHGSHTGGTIAGLRYGEATGASILNYAVFDSRGYAATGAGLTSAWTDAANRKASIASMSFGCARMALCFSASEVRTMASAPLSGMLFVKAAGNDGASLGNEAIAVTAAEGKTALGRLLLVGSVSLTGAISTFSNRPGEGCLLSAGATACAEDMKWKYRFIVAPGEQIYATLPGNTYGYMSGTSMATPVVAGAAALLEARWPTLKAKPSAVADILLNSATDLGAKGVDPVYGRGLLNVDKAFQNAGTTSIIAPTGEKVVVSNTSVTTAPVMGRTAVALSGVVAIDAYGRDYTLGEISNLSVRRAQTDAIQTGSPVLAMGGLDDWAPQFFAPSAAPAAWFGFRPLAAAGSDRFVADQTLRAGLDAPAGGALVSLRLTGRDDVRSDFAADPALLPLSFFASSALLNRSVLGGINLPVGASGRLIVFGGATLRGAPTLRDDTGGRIDTRAHAVDDMPTFGLDRSPLTQASAGISYWMRPDSRTVVGVNLVGGTQRHGFYDLASDLASFNTPVHLGSLGVAASRAYGAWELYGAAETTLIDTPSGRGPVAFTDSVLVSGEAGVRLSHRGVRPGIHDTLTLSLRASPQAAAGHLRLDYMAATEDGLDLRPVHRSTDLADVTGRPIRFEASYALTQAGAWTVRAQGGVALAGDEDTRLSIETQLRF